MCIDVHKNIAKMLGMSEEEVGETLKTTRIAAYFNYINILFNVFGLGK
jgi:thiaminase